MATNIVRAKAAAEAIADKTLTNQLLAEIGDAFAYTYRRGETLTNEQKATVFINTLRSFVKQVVRDWKTTTAMDTARQTAEPTATPDLGEEGSLP
jgi:hypothetical protein